LQVTERRSNRPSVKRWERLSMQKSVFNLVSFFHIGSVKTLVRIFQLINLANLSKIQWQH
jgi:hypothetical protein